ncbi:MAG: hypothetical protein IPI58_07455 [Alphaproteobacteria bacterium]|nr:MAG: hypothetical protein IPI58_07455 [Alphaproteobacteria bacterium]
MKPALISLISQGLRLAALISKFVLIMYMGRYLPLDDIGWYGALMGAVVLYSKLVGMGLNYVVNRECATLGRESLLALLVRQFKMYAPVHLVIALTALIAAIALKELDIGQTCLILAILIGEHLGQETLQVLIVRQKQLMANLTFFLRSGLPFLIVPILGILFPETRHFSMILGLWLVGIIVSLVVAVIALRRNIAHASPSLPHEPRQWDRAWLVGALKAGLWPMFSSFALAGSLYADRYGLSVFRSIEQSGSFVLLWSFANAVYVLVTTGVTQISYPQMIHAWRNGEKDVFRQIKSRMQRRQWAVSLGLSLVALGLLQPILSWLGKAGPEQASLIFGLLLVGFALRAAADGLTWTFYARSHDRDVVILNLAALAVAAPATLILVPMAGILGAAMVLPISSAVALGLGLFKERRLVESP